MPDRTDPADEPALLHRADRQPLGVPEKRRDFRLSVLQVLPGRRHMGERSYQD